MELASRRELVEEKENFLNNAPASAKDLPGNSHGSLLTDETLSRNEDSSPAGGCTKTKDIVYGVGDVPPWQLTILLGVQHCLVAIGSTISIPLILISLMCIPEESPGQGGLVSSIVFVSGIATLIQTTFGVRLPIVQGGTFSFLVPTMAILSAKFPKCDSYNFSNMTFDEKEELWMEKIREIQGAIIISAIFQMFLGFTGLIGFVLTWITPLSIAPTITLIGISLFKPVAKMASGNWAISAFTTGLLILFAQFMTNITIPIPMYQKGNGLTWRKFQVFKLFPILLAIFISWGMCVILTHFDVLPVGNEARTDYNLKLIEKSPWFYLPYPFQWGLPTVSITGVFGMFTGVLASVVESIGDYYAGAELSGISPPPKHAVNRGIGMEGVGCLIAGIFGTGNGTTSYSQNLAVIRLTKVASTRVIQVSAIFLLLFGVFGKFGAAATLIPRPIIGGTFFVIFAFIVGVGVSNLQMVDITSSRNIFVIGTSLFWGIAIPEWINLHSDSVQTGSKVMDQVIIVLLTTHMFVGGLCGFLFDNLIPGTMEERGLHEWNKYLNNLKEEELKSKEYDLPFGMEALRKMKCCSRIPFSPTFEDYGNERKCFV